MKVLNEEMNKIIDEVKQKVMYMKNSGYRNFLP